VLETVYQTLALSPALSSSDVVVLMTGVKE
jgi:hypothetical protein